MKKIGFAPPDSNDDDEKSKPSINEQIFTNYIDENYETHGDVEQKEFRTTLELITETSEMVMVGMNTVNTILQKKGFKTIFIEGVSNWILYEKKQS